MGERGRFSVSGMCPAIASLALHAHCVVGRRRGPEGATSLAGRDLRYIGHRRGCADSRLSGMVVSLEIDTQSCYTGFCQRVLSI